MQEVFRDADADHLAGVATNSDTNLPHYGLDSALRQAHFFVQVMQERSDDGKGGDRVGREGASMSIFGALSLMHVTTRSQSRRTQRTEFSKYGSEAHSDMNGASTDNIDQLRQIGTAAARQFDLARTRSQVVLKESSDT